MGKEVEKLDFWDVLVGRPNSEWKSCVPRILEMILDEKVAPQIWKVFNIFKIKAIIIDSKWKGTVLFLLFNFLGDQISVAKLVRFD